MLYLVRRRVREDAVALFNRAVRFFHWLRYQFRMRRMGISERYIREAFSYLVQLDLTDWSDVEWKGHLLLRFQAFGNFLHVKVLGNPEAPPIYEFTMSEGFGNSVYVHEWRDEKREIRLAPFNVKHETNWWEVFRTGRCVENTRFLDYIRALYGSGPKKEAVA